MQLDDTHIQMIDLLRENARVSIASIAERLGISRSNAYQRYEWLVETGVVTGFTATLDFGAAGLGVAALVFVTLDQRRWTEFRRQLDDVAELEYFAVTTGQHDGMMLVRAPDVAAIHELVSLELARWPSIKSTETVFLMDEQWDRVNISACLRERGEDQAPLAGQLTGQLAGQTRFIRTRTTPARSSRGDAGRAAGAAEGPDADEPDAD